MALGVLKFTRNLIIGFTVVFVLSLFTGLATWYNMQQTTHYNGLVLDGHKAIGRVQGIQLMIARMVASRRGYRITGDETYLKNYRPLRMQIAEAVERMAQSLSDVKGQKQQLTEIRTSTADLLHYWDSLELNRQLILEMDKRVLTDLERTKAKTTFDALTRLADLERESLRQSEVRSEEVNRYTAWQLGASIFIIEGIIFALVVVIRREFRKRRASEKSMKRQLSAVQRLNAVRDEKNWLLQGLTLVRDSIQEAEGLDDLARKCLMSVLQYTGSAAGALYVVDEADSSLHLRASMGLPHNHPRRYLAGEGLPGHAAAAAHTIRSGPIAEQAFTLNGATVSAPTGEVLLVPFCHNRVVVAVMELAAFQAFPPNAITLLEEVGTSIATAINAAKAGQRADELLQEVQSKKEALEQQREELHQTNDALTLQAEELQISQDELRQLNEKLEGQNDRLEATREALVQQAAALERSNRYKSDFLANVSHELRTPLNSILILARLLKDQESTPDGKQQEYAGIIHKSGADLLALINDILDFSKIEAGKLDIEPARVMVEDISRQMKDLFEVQAGEKDITLEINCVADCPEQITTDPQRLAQILKNLLSNAIKFTDRGGRVTLDFHQLDGKGAQPAIAMHVTDTGIGIPLAKQHQIFEAFQQADSAINRRYGGTGLGLSISRELSRLLGGSLTVRSEEGKGSVFTLMLPQAITAGDAQAAPAAAQRAVSDDRELPSEGTPRVLIAEDDPSFASALRDVARAEGFLTIVALDGADALRDVQQYRPDAIILDMHLPGKDGWQILRQLAQDGGTRHIPVHVISSATQQIPVGPVAVLRKPTGHESLRQMFVGLKERLSASENNPGAEAVQAPDAGAEQPGGARPSAVLQNRVALIVDDDMRNIFALSLLLQSQGMEVLTAGDGREALHMLAEHPETEIVLLDVMMPEMDGCEALRRIREQPALAGLPVIMLSASGLAEQEKSMALGASDFIRKPVDNDRLLSLLALWLNAKR